MYSIKIEQNDIDVLTSVYPPETFKESEVIYEGQIPNICLLLIEGHAECVLKKNRVGSIQPQEIIGLKEIINSKELGFTVRVSQDSKISILDKSSLFKHIGLYDSSTSDHIGELINKYLK